MRRADSLDDPSPSWSYLCEVLGVVYGGVQQGQTLPQEHAISATKALVGELYVGDLGKRIARYMKKFELSSV